MPGAWLLMVRMRGDNRHRKQSPPVAILALKHKVMETTSLKYQVKQLAWPEKQFLCRREKVSFDKLPEFFSRSYRVIYAALSKNGIQTVEPPFAIYHCIDEMKKEADLSAAVCVEKGAVAPGDLEVLTIPASSILSVTYYGPCEEMLPAYSVLEQYAAAHNLTRKWLLEQYFSDPRQVPDPRKWRTDIHFVVD